MNAIAIIVGWLLVFVINSFCVKYCWNGVMPRIFPALSEITFLEASALVVMCDILFKQKLTRQSSDK